MTGSAGPVRVLDINALVCPGCGGAMVVLAFLTDPPVVRRILDHLDLPSAAPRLSPARCVDDEESSLPFARRDADKEIATTKTAPRRLPSRAPS